MVGVFGEGATKLVSEDWGGNACRSCMDTLGWEKESNGQYAMLTCPSCTHII